MSGKGDTYRPTNQQSFDDNYEKIFKNHCTRCGKKFASLKEALKHNENHDK